MVGGQCIKCKKLGNLVRHPSYFGWCTRCVYQDQKKRNPVVDLPRPVQRAIVEAGPTGRRFFLGKQIGRVVDDGLWKRATEEEKRKEAERRRKLIEMKALKKMEKEQEGVQDE